MYINNKENPIIVIVFPKDIYNYIRNNCLYNFAIHDTKFAIHDSLVHFLQNVVNLILFPSVSKICFVYIMTR